MKQTKYRADIDGLRAVAVLAVIGFHAFPSWVKGGFIGVDVFFVISGYLISGIIFEKLQSNHFSFLEFYGRRIKRIFPALLIVMLACLAMGWLTLFADEYQQLGKHVAGGAGFVSNLLLWQEVDYFDNAAVTKPLLHLWSLGIEEQFYIIWPLCLWIAWKKRLRLLAIMIIVASASFVLNISMTGKAAVADFYSPQTRFWELLAGSLLAYISLYPTKLISKLNQKWVYRFNRQHLEQSITRLHKVYWRNFFSFVGIAGIALGFLLIHKDSFFPGWWALVPVTGTFFIISAGPAAWPNRVVLSNRVFVWIGLISYPLYLWHWPFLSFVRIIQGQSTSLGMRIGIIALAFVLASLTYMLIERPIRFGQHNRIKILSLILLMSLAGGGGYGIFFLGGIPWRTVMAINPSEHTGWDGGAEGHLVNECGITNIEDKKLFATCEKDDRQTAKYALLGDSKAAALFRGLMRTSFEDGRWLVIGGHGTQGSPVPVLSDNKIYKSYQKLTNIAIDAIISNVNIETVVFMTATRVLFRLGNDHSIEGLATSKNYAAALDGLKNAAEKFIRAGKKVVIIVDNPTLPAPRDCLNRRTSSLVLNKILLRKSNENCRLRLSRHLALSAKYRKLLLEVQNGDPDNISIFDTTPYMCDMTQEVCLPYKNGRRLYRYTDHVSDYASGLIGQGLNDFLQERLP